MIRLMISFGVLLLAAGGCAHGPLASRGTKSQNLDEFYQQQVLDNLAMFIEDSRAMPHVVASGETSQESYAADVQSTTQNRHPISTSGNAHKQLALAPVSNPAKVLGIRAEFQRAASLYTASRTPASHAAPHEVNAHESPRITSPLARAASPGKSTGKQGADIALSSHQQVITVPPRGTASIPAPNYRQMYGVGRADHRTMPEQSVASNEFTAHAATVAVSPKCGCQKCVAKRNADAQMADTFVQPGETPRNNCWYAVGNPKEIPQSYDGKVGRYGKTCVWVPAKGHAEFQQLVTSVMDKAKTEQPTSTPTLVKTSHQAKPAIAPKSYRMVAATIPIAGDPLGKTPKVYPVANRSSQEVQPTTVLVEQNIQDSSKENESLTFDRELSLQALSDWNSNETKGSTGASTGSKTAGLEQRQLQNKRY